MALHPKKDQFDRKYAPIQRAQVLRDADRAANKELYETMLEITKESNYIRNTDPHSVKVFKDELAKLISEDGPQKLKSVAESAVRQILDRKMNADAESDQMKQQMDALQGAMFEIWPGLRLMVEDQITTFIQRYNDADRQSREYSNKLVEKEVIIRALEVELAALKSPSKSAETSEELGRILQAVKKLSQQREFAEEADAAARDAKAALLLETTNRKIVESELAQRNRELSTVREDLVNERLITSQVQGLRLQRDQSRSSFQEKAREVRELKENLSRKDDALGAAMVQNHILSNDVHNLTRDKALKDDEIGKLKTDVNRLESSCKTHQDQAEVIRLQAKERDDQITAKEAELHLLTGQVSEKEASIESLKQKIEALYGAIGSMQKESNNRQGEIEHLRVESSEQRSEYDVLNEKYTAKANELLALQAAQRPVNAADLRNGNDPFLTRLDNERLERDKQSLKEQKAKLVGEKADLARDNAIISSELRAATDKLGAVDQEVQKLTGDLDKLQIEHMSKVQDVIRLEGQMVTEKANCQAIQDQKEQLQASTSREISDLKDSLQVKESQLSSETKANDRLRNSCETYQRELERAQLDHQSLVDEKWQLSQQLTEVTGECNSLSMKLEAKEEDFTGLTSDMKGLRMNLLSRTAERDAYMSKVIEATKNSSEMMLTNASLTRDLRAKEEDAAKLRSALDGARGDKTALQKQLGKANEQGKHLERLISDEKSGRLSGDRKVRELQASLAASNSARDLAEQRNQEVYQEHEEITRKLLAQLEKAEAKNAEIWGYFEKQRSLKQQAQKAADIATEGMTELNKRMDKLADSVDQWNERASNAEQLATQARYARDTAVREADRNASLYEEEKHRADMEHRKAEMFLQQKFDASKKYREELAKLSEGNDRFYQTMRAEVGEHNRISMENLKRWQEEKRQLESIIDGYEIQAMGHSLSASGGNIKLAGVAAWEPRRQIPLDEDSVVVDLTQLQNPSVNPESPGTGISHLHGGTDEGLADADLTPTMEQGSAPGDVTQLPSDTDDEMLDRAEDPADISMTEEYQADQTSGIDRTESETPVPATDNEMDVEMEHTHLASRVSTPDKSEGGVSLRGEVNPPELMVSIETEEPTSGQSPVADRGISAGPLASRESSVVSVSSSALRNYSVNDVEFLISGKPTEGPRTTAVHPSVKQALSRSVADWQKKGRSKGAWAKPSEIFRCVETRLSRLSKGRNVPKGDHKTACSRCVQSGLPCVLVLRGSAPVVLPLPKLRRSTGATQQDPGYYIVV